MTAQPRRVPKSSSGATTALWSHACGLAGRSPGASAARCGSGARNTVTVPTRTSTTIAAKTQNQPPKSESAPAPAPADRMPTRDPDCIDAAPTPLGRKNCHDAQELLYLLGLRVDRILNKKKNN